MPTLLIVIVAVVVFVAQLFYFVASKEQGTPFRTSGIVSLATTE